MRREMMIILALISLLLAQGNTQSPGRVEHNLTVTDRMIGELAGEVGANTP